MYDGIIPPELLEIEENLFGRRLIHTIPTILVGQELADLPCREVQNPYFHAVPATWPIYDGKYAPVF